MFTEFVDSFVGLPTAEIDDALREITLQERELAAKRTALLIVADAQQAYQADGHRSMRGYLKAQTHCSDIEASRLRSIIRLLALHPEIGDGWAHGHYGTAQVLELAGVFANPRARPPFGVFVPLFVEQAEKLCFDDFRIFLQVFVTWADPDGAHDDRDHAVKHRNAHVVVNGSELDVSANGGDPILAAEVVGIYRRFVEIEYQADVEARRAQYGDDAALHELPRTPQQRGFDAFVAIFRTAAINQEAGVEPAPAAAVTVNVVIDEASFDQMLDEAGVGEATDDDLLANAADLLDRRCELADGTPVNPHDVLRAALTGHVRRVITNGAGVVINQGRRQRLFTGAAREAAMLLIRRCQHPGCHLPTEWCQVDHNKEWVDGGETTQDNGGIECLRHNLLKHHKKFTRKRANNGQTYTIRGDGTIMLAVGQREPTFPDPPEEIERMNHLARQRVAALRLAG